MKSFSWERLNLIMVVVTKMVEVKMMVVVFNLVKRLRERGERRWKATLTDPADSGSWSWGGVGYLSWLWCRTMVTNTCSQYKNWWLGLTWLHDYNLPEKSVMAFGSPPKLWIFSFIHRRAITCKDILEKYLIILKKFDRRQSCESFIHHLHLKVSLWSYSSNPKRWTWT